ncbi:DUF86 domain-containing protein [Paraburkholderia sp. LEh10]|uniref:HepT-like ribonuclease domain-containing protein n=1 Tax=Paraburkholderia sp. LEh10 TaxID=2821353 RepID=UPI001AEB373C|nr:HepT-like ribonuclease domain-containing protein [Paraburkholderia sp. LEh10]MBP0591642.1 DUF86 domain-containing protein [Paraburkholderia sp. LEh10]
MKNSDLSIADCLERMLEAIARIEHYTEDLTDDTFRIDSLVQDAVILNLGIIGSVACDVARKRPDFAAAHAHVPWEKTCLACNRLTRDYFSIDADRVWQTVVRDLPVLKEQLAQIRRPTS